MYTIFVVVRFEGEQSIIALTVYDAQEQKAILRLNNLFSVARALKDRQWMNWNEKKNA